MIQEVLRDSLIFLNLEAETDTDVFKALGGELTRQGYAKDIYVKALRDREDEYPTGLDIDGIGVAIPHTDVTNVNETAVAVATLKNPVVFHVMGGDDDETVNVNLVFMLCVSDPNGHIDELQRVIALIQDKKVLENLCAAQSKEEIRSIISEKENELDA